MSQPRLATICSAQKPSKTAAIASERHPLKAKSIGTTTRPGGGAGKLMRGIGLIGGLLLGWVGPTQGRPDSITAAATILRIMARGAWRLDATTS